MTAIPAGGVRISLAAALPDAPPPLVVDRGEHGPTVDAQPTAARLARLDGEHAVLRESPGGEAHRALILGPDADARQSSIGVLRREVVIDGWRVEVTLEPEARAALRERARRDKSELGRSGPTQVHAIIPGVVVSVSVAPGDEVTAGQQLLVVEAMKMQNELRAPRDGTVEQVAVGAGSTIEVGDLLLVLA